MQRILLDWCRVSLEYNKIGQAKERLRWQGGRETIWNKSFQFEKQQISRSGEQDLSLNVNYRPLS